MDGKHIKKNVKPMQNKSKCNIIQEPMAKKKLI